VVSLEAPSASTTFQTQKSTKKRRANAKQTKTTSKNTLQRFCTNIFENVPAAALIVEKPDGRIKYANKLALELLGINPYGLSLKKYALLMKISSLDGKLSRVESLPTYRALFNGEIVKGEKMMMERPDGKRLVVSGYARPIREANEIMAAVVFFDDVSEQFQTQKELSESEERLRMAQEIAHVGVWEVNVKEDSSIWSEEMFRIFGLEPQKHSPTTTEYVHLIYPDDREAINTTMEQMLFDKVPFKVSFDYRIVRKNGKIRNIHSERMVKEFDQDKRPLRIIGVEQDITERKQIERQLENYAKNLEKLVEERTKQLQDAQRLATIGQTAGMIGHDIRNPLQTIAGELFLMLQETDTEPDSHYKKETQESLEVIQEQADYINKIVTDLQDYTRPLQPELVEVNVFRAIPQVLSTVKVPDYIQLHMEPADKVLKLKLDMTFFKRILVNLVTNAIQAMPDGGELSIDAFEEDDMVSITVADTGVGIPDEVKPKLFQPLMTTKSKGQGFGLAVVKRLVEALGGKISFQSKVREGTTFKVSFPK
jgi:PAS domain S-box-containing protein